MTGDCLPKDADVDKPRGYGKRKLRRWLRRKVSGPQIQTGNDADTSLPRGPEKKEKVCG